MTVEEKMEIEKENKEVEEKKVDSVDKKEETPKPGDIEYTRNVKKQIDKLTREKYDAIRKASALEKKVQEFESEKITSNRPQRPARIDFEDEYGEVNEREFGRKMDEYEDQLIAWQDARKAIRTIPESSIPKEDSDTSDITARYSVYMEQAEIARKKYADFDTATEADVFTQDMRDSILDSEHQAEIAYQIAKDKAVALKLRSMSSSQIIREVAKMDEKISNSLRLSNNFHGSKAPEPINPVNSNRGSPKESDFKDDDKLSAAEYFDKYLGKKGKR